MTTCLVCGEPLAKYTLDRPAGDEVCNTYCKGVLDERRRSSNDPIPDASLSSLARASAWLSKLGIIDPSTGDPVPYTVASLAALLDGQRERCAQELYDLARWCRDHGYEARARHTESAARRLQSVATEDT